MSNNAQYRHRRETKPQAELIVLFQTHRNVLSWVFWKNTSQQIAETELPNVQGGVTIWTPQKVVLFDRKAGGQGKSSMFPCNGQGFKALFVQGRWATCFGTPQGTALGNDVIKIPLNFFTDAHRGNMWKLKFQVALKKGFINYFHLPGHWHFRYNVKKTYHKLKLMLWDWTETQPRGNKLLQ